MFKLNLIVLKVETQLTNYFFIPESTFLRSPTSLLFLRMQYLTHAQTLKAPPCTNHHPFLFAHISTHTLRLRETSCAKTFLANLRKPTPLASMSPSPSLLRRETAPLFATQISIMHNNNFCFMKILLNRHH